MMYSNAMYYTHIACRIFRGFQVLTLMTIILLFPKQDNHKQKFNKPHSYPLLLLFSPRHSPAEEHS